MSDSVFENLNTEQAQTNVPVVEEQTSQQQDVKPAESVNPDSLWADQLAGIKTSDGRQKYADVKTALASIPHAQGHIKELTDKVRELEEQLTKSKSMDEVLQRIQASQSNSESPSVSGLSEAHVLELLNSALNQREETSKAVYNEKEVTKVLVEKYGDTSKAIAALQSKADELGVDVGFLQQLAQKSPKAVLSYFNAQPSNTPRSTTPGINTSALQTPAKTNAIEEARARLLGKGNALVDKWRAAAQS